MQAEQDHLLNKPPDTYSSTFLVKLITVSALVLGAYCVTWYTFTLYRLTDSVIAGTALEYEPKRTYYNSERVFFHLLILFSIWAYYYGKGKLKHYILRAFGTCLPVVFSLSMTATVWDINLPVKTFYHETYCLNNLSNKFCGPGFAQFVYNSTIKAIPVLLTSPILFWLSVFRFSRLIHQAAKGRLR